MLTSSKAMLVAFVAVASLQFALASEATGATAAGGNSTASAAKASAAAKAKLASAQADKDNDDYSKWMLCSLAAFAGLPLLYRFIFVVYAQIRLLVSMHAENQRYFATPSTEWIPWVKRHMLWAPLFRNRHNKEFQLSQAGNYGTLPTRFQTFFLVGYIVGNAIFCTYMIHWDAGTATVLGEVRNRSGVLSTVNMVPLFILAGRNNPLIQILGISFDTHNLIHRWLGRIVVIEALVHTLTWMAAKTLVKGGWQVIRASITATPFLRWGFIATCSFTFLIFHSPSVIRHAFYETFLTLHIMAAALATTGVYYHLKLKSPDLDHWLKYIESAIALWAIDRTLRIVWLVYRNIGRRMTSATVEALPGDAVRVTLRLARPWKFHPGQHLYLYMPSVGLWTSHPFTIAWSQDEQYMKYDDDKLSLHRQDIIHQGHNTISLIIRARTGFTEKLHRRALASPDAMFTTKALAEGPYGKLDTLSSYGTVVLIAGGIGITHPVPYVKKLVEGYAAGTVATRRITLVWVIQTPDHLEWIRPWMTEILAMEKRREVLKILLFVTRPKSTKEIHSPSATVQMFPGRPNIETLIGMECEQKMGTMAVTVCGSGALSDDVRKAVRSKAHITNIEFIEEAFTW